MTTKTLEKEIATADEAGEIEQRIWELATDKSLHEVAGTLAELMPYVPPTPEMRLQAAIFGRRLLDYRPVLVEIFLRLHHPEGEWDDYREWCRTWVTGMLEDSIKYETDLLKGPLEQLLGILPERLKTILWIRFGFDNRGAKTLEQVGREFNLCKERIRQLEAKALRTLRHPSRSRDLRQILPGEGLRIRLFAELNGFSTVPPIFLLWEEDYRMILNLKRWLDQAATKNQKQNETASNQAGRESGVRVEENKRTDLKLSDSDKGETAQNVPKEFRFPGM